MQKKDRTQRINQAQIIRSLENLYISPLEKCNLRCRYCYTLKTKNILSNQQILSFINRYRHQVNLKSIIFCGGEVFILTSFPSLINQLLQLNIFITIITNGTIDRLTEIKNPNSYQLIVSFDGPEHVHDHNRGQGNFQKSLAFVKHALSLGFHVEIFFLVTKDSYPHKDSFHVLDLHQTYLIDRLGSLSSTQTKNILENYSTYPPKNFGCHQISLQSNSLVYPCCETQKPIGNISDPIKKIINNYLNLVNKNNFCTDPDYFCNLNKFK